MNKVDVLLNTISQKHLCVEILESPPRHACSPQPVSLRSLHTALLAAFKGGVSHAAGLAGRRPGVLIREVDIDLRQLESEAMAGKVSATASGHPPTSS